MLNKFKQFILKTIYKRTTMVYLIVYDGTTACYKVKICRTIGRDKNNSIPNTLRFIECTLDKDCKPVYSISNTSAVKGSTNIWLISNIKAMHAVEALNAQKGWLL